MRARDPQKERAICEKALDTIVRCGFDGLSMQKLAKEVGVSPATIYIYFENRDDLILSLYRDESRKMAEATLEGFDPGASLAVGLRVQWKNRARYCLENPREAHFLEQIRHSPFHSYDEPGKGRDFIEAMRTFCRGAIERGELVRVPVEVYWSVAFAEPGFVTPTPAGLPGPPQLLTSCVGPVASGLPRSCAYPFQLTPAASNWLNSVGTLAG